MNEAYGNQDFELDEKSMELLDLYIIGALESEEVENAQKLISNSQKAREYVDEARAMFANFEDNDTHSEPLLESIKTQIAIGEREQTANSSNASDSSVVPISSKRSVIIPFISGAIAASFIAVMLSVILISNSNNAEPEKFALDDQVSAFASGDETKVISLTNEIGEVGLKVMMDEKGDIMIDCRTLESLDKDSTYQLWAIVETATGQKVISAGVLGSEPGVSMSKVSGEVVAFSLTKEVAGGVDKSEQEAMYSASVA